MPRLSQLAQRIFERREALLIVGGLLLAVTLAAVLSFLFLGEQSLWFDEVNSVLFAKTLFENAALLIEEAETNMYLYYLLLRFWLHFGESEFWIRSLSALFAVASVPVIFALGSRLFGRRAGMLAALLLSVNPFFVQCAQEARSYSLLLFLVTLNLYFFVRSVQEPSTGNWICYTITFVLSVYSHFLAVLVTLAELVSLAFLSKRRIPWRNLVSSGIGATILLLPMALAAILYTSKCLAVGDSGLSSGPPIIDPLAILARNGLLLGILYYFLLLCFLLLLSFRAVKQFFRERHTLQAWPLAVPLLGTVAPLLVMIIASLGLKRELLPRYLTICLPSLLLLAAYGLNVVRPKWLRVALALVYFSLAALPLHYHYKHEQKEQWRSATQFVVSNANSGDAVIFVAYMVRAPFEYYCRHLRLHCTRLEIPKITSGRYRRGGSMPEPPPDERDLDLLSTKYRRVWLILSHADAYGRDLNKRQIRNSLEKNYRVVLRANFVGIEALLYERIRDPRIRSGSNQPQA